MKTQLASASYRISAGAAHAYMYLRKRKRHAQRKKIGAMNYDKFVRNAKHEFEAH